MQNNNISTYNKYLSALETCRNIAQEEYSTVVGHFSQCDEIVEDLRHLLDGVVKRANQTLSHNRVLEDGLSSIQRDLDKDHRTLRDKRTSNLEKQKSTLQYFNVMLFGRTMAGKSTIREAITHGDGQTIGKGAQRTTRDIKEYEWNNLRIIDTPGFGASNGQEDTKIAREILEQSDVVLFILNSDSIQESTFVELEHVYKLNKPLIFVLNIKKNLENEGNRRRALRDPNKYIFKPEDIEQHFGRLKSLAARAGIDPSTVSIIPIHAQAGFLATLSKGEERKELHSLSRLDELLAVLQTEVRSNGPIRRVHTFLDSSLQHIDSQNLLLLEQKERLGKLLSQYESSLVRITQWKNKTLRDVPRTLTDAVNAAFKPLIDSVGDFVDDHIEDKKIGKAWENHFNNFNISKKIEQSAKSLSDQLVEDLKDFNREMSEGLDISLAFDVQHNGQHFNDTDFKRLNGWGSAITSVIGAVAFWNSWNPVGWAAAGTAALFTIFTFFSDSRSKKLKEAKSKQRQLLLVDIEKNKTRIIANLNNWFEKSIHHSLIIPALHNLTQLCESVRAFTLALSASENKLEELKYDINFRLLNRIAYIVSAKHFQLPKIKRIVRIPGYACYLVISSHFRNSDLLRNLSQAMHENILAVYDNGLENQLLHLYSGLIKKIEIPEEGKVNLHVKMSNMSKVIGKEHRRIKMAAATCLCEIKLISV